MRRLLPLLTVATALTVVAPAEAAWTPPETISAPHTFVSGLEAGTAGNGTVVADWGFQDGIGNGAARGARGASLLPGAPAFAPERTLPRDVLQVVPYARRSIAALTFTPAFASARDRLAVGFGSPDGPFLGAVRTVVTEDIAFLPRLAVASNGSGVLAWIARASGNRRIVRVAIKGAGHGFGRPSTIVGTGRADAVTAAVSPQGDRLVAFVRSGRLFARYRRVGRDWRPVQDLGPVAAGSENRLAALITSGGRAIVADAHRQLSEGGDAGPLVVDAWTQPVGASRFRAAQRLETAAGVAASAPALVATESRGAALAWAGGDPGVPPTPDGPSTRVRASVQGADGRFGPPQAISPAAQPVKAVAAASSAGQALVTWVRIDPQSDGDGQVLAAVRPPFGAFGAPEAVSPSENASITAPAFAGTGPQERPIVLWASRPEGEGPGVPIGQIRTFVRAAQRTP
jgi:hypothetical protein